MLIRRLLARSLLALSFALPTHCPAGASNDTILVFAAASLKNAVDDVDAAFARTSGTRTNASFAASSSLAKQIEQGAPADIFISADLDWMEFLSSKGLIRRDTRVNLLGNRLVLIAPRDSTVAHVGIGPGFDLARLAGDGRIAVADVRAVPAGKYAEAALQKLGAWGGAKPKLAMTENVRAALALVGRGEAPLGIVYETDAKIEKDVKIVGYFPADSHPPIVYPAALTAHAKPRAARYLEFLRSAAAKTIFEAYGFRFLIEPSS